MSHFTYGYLKRTLSTNWWQCIIAGILLKLGSYGFLRLYLFISIATEFYRPFVLVLALLGIIFVIYYLRQMI